MSPPELLDLEIARGVTTRDVVRFQRLLKFLARSRSAELDRSHLSADDRREARLLYVETDTFLRVAASFGLDRALAETLVSTFSWDALEPSRLDLQHTPILALRDHVLVPLAVASDSNLIRNGLWSSGRRPSPDGRIDPLVADLRLAFEIAGLRVAERQVRVDWQDVRDRPDRGGARTSSCSRRRTRWSRAPGSSCGRPGTPSKRPRSSWIGTPQRSPTPRCDPGSRNRLGMDVAAARIATCTVVAHPLVSGSRVLWHPVRQCDVVCNFVASGEGTAWTGEAGVTTRLRPEGKLNEAELLGLLDDDTSVYREAWAAGLKRVRPARIGKAVIHVVEYAFNPVIQLARSGLCTGELQAALDAAIARVSSLADDAPRNEVDAAWRDAAAAHEAAFASLDVAAHAADVRGGARVDERRRGGRPRLAVSAVEARRRARSASRWQQRWAPRRRLAAQFVPLRRDRGGLRERAATIQRSPADPRLDREEPLRECGEARRRRASIAPARAYLSSTTRPDLGPTRRGRPRGPLPPRGRGCQRRAISFVQRQCRRLRQFSSRSRPPPSPESPGLNLRRGDILETVACDLARPARPTACRPAPAPPLASKRHASPAPPPPSRRGPRERPGSCR